MAEEKTPLKWKFKTGNSVYSSPAVVDGVAYFGTHDNHLYALDSEAASALGKEENKRREEADKHGITAEDIRTKYISGDITLEEALELQTQDQKRQEEEKKRVATADKNQITEEDIRTKYISGEITLERELNMHSGCNQCCNENDVSRYGDYEYQYYYRPLIKYPTVSVNKLDIVHSYERASSWEYEFVDIIYKCKKCNYYWFYKYWEDELDMDWMMKTENFETPRICR